ncbi:hypothetical protein EX227_22920 [Providencia rettgeri]|uniref:Uncharacterized protein n=1 Tax=Providencia rettgeri TaxID=587 RepID=A0AAP2K0M6_PRORE|nr:hypothetical protein [Providencia rettgeri]MBX6952687.1 hypothetical protein [Providencia rettgeri]MBX6957676.1 hypothetical protein [Providencia rettgeri]MBX6962441.1 hypothetical protein [Providencia rettgeri]MBX6974730.1 hypothetical protein [Providencia rettgeri]MBX6982199.1 hypothetical protein [Providencia rettgeri]
MNNEILELAKKTKESIKSLKYNHYFEDVPINQEQLLLICEYIEQNNNLHPVAFITQEAANRMNDGIVSNVYVSKDKSPAFNTPIFIQK